MLFIIANAEVIFFFFFLNISNPCHSIFQHPIILSATMWQCIKYLQASVWVANIFIFLFICSTEKQSNSCCWISVTMDCHCNVWSLKYWLLIQNKWTILFVWQKTFGNDYTGQTKLVKHLDTLAVSYTHHAQKDRWQKLLHFWLIISLFGMKPLPTRWSVSYSFSIASSSSAP